MDPTNMEPTEELPFPVQVTFHGVERSEGLEQAVLHYVGQLPHYHPRIHGVRVVFTRAAAHHRVGSPYQVQVRVAVPGNDVVVSHHHAQHVQHQDPMLTLNDAFRAVQRQLEDDVRVRRGDVKTPAEGLQQGRIARLPATDHGFLETPDGREVYFHRNSVLEGRFEELEVGTSVRFAEEEGLQGPQASTVHVMR